MTELRAFRTDFEPIARVDERVLLIPQYKLYEVVWVQAVQPIVKDFGSLTSGSSSTKTELDTELELEENELGQWRIEPIDDVKVAVFLLSANRMFSTRYTDTYIELLNPKHSIYSSVPAGIETLLWTVTSGRKAILDSITIGNTGASANTVVLRDGSGAANNVWSIEVPVNDSVSYGGTALPDVEFETDVRVYADDTCEVTVGLEEQNFIDTFKNSQNKEVFTFEEDVLSIQGTNPTNVTQTKNRVSISGFRYRLKPLPEIVKPYIVVPTRAIPTKPT